MTEYEAGVLLGIGFFLFLYVFFNWADFFRRER